MRLQDKFKRVFILPLICGVLISLILTVIILIQYANNFSDDALISRLAELEKGKTNPVIMTVKDLLFKKFQKSIYSLILFKKYFNFYAKQLENSAVDINLLQKHFVNGADYYENYDVRNEEAKKDKDTYLDKAIWHTTNKARKLEELDMINKEQLIVISHLIPYVRSWFETSQDKESYRADSIYYCNKRSEQVFMYPLFPSQSSFKMFYNYTTPSWCKDQNGKHPDYWYFPCRDWYLQIKNVLESHPSQKVFITHPYKFAAYADKFGLTVCLQFEDPVAMKYPSADPLSSLTLICVDIFFSDIIDAFDHFNKELSGYFFVLRVDSDVPIYYPLILKSNYFSDIARYEFDLDASFYVDELNEFSANIVSLFTKNYDNDTLTSSDTINSNGTIQSFSSINSSISNYKKNGTVNKFLIYPIKLFTNENNLSEPHHILTTVYIYRDDLFAANIKGFQSTLYPKLGIEIFLFGIMGALLVLIAWYLIIIMAINIVNPIKNLQNLIQMNLGADTIIQEEMNDRIRASRIELREANKKELRQGGTGNHQLKRKSISNLKHLQKPEFTNEEDNSDQEDANADVEDEMDEDQLEIRNEEMDKLFEILLNLKNVLLFTTNSRTSFNKSALVEFANSKHVFDKVQNERGMNVCDSNIGNLSLLCHKYDKAIMHLFSAIAEENPNNADSNNTSSKASIIIPQKSSAPLRKWDINYLKEKIEIKIEELNLKRKANWKNNNQRTISLLESKSLVKEEHFSDLNENKTITTNPQNVNQNKKDINKLIKLESRYPKLIYAYKNFFKFLRQFLKSIEAKSKDNMTMNSYSELFEADIFFFQKNHSLDAFESIITDYIYQSVEADDMKRICESLLEYIEFLITYKLKWNTKLEKFGNDSRDIKESCMEGSETSSEVHKYKLGNLSQISVYFHMFEKIYELLSEKANCESYKEFLDLLHTSRKDTTELMETSYLILYQKGKYLKGKLSKICGHCDKAIEYFMESSKEALLISNALITKKSIKQIIKIMNYLQIGISKDIEKSGYGIMANFDILKGLPLSPCRKNRADGTTVISLGKRAELIRKNKEIENYIEKLTQNLDSLISVAKDLIVLIDVSHNRMKIEKAIKATINIFDSYISSRDRFALFIHSASTNTVVPLTEKNFNTYSFVKGVISDLIDSNEILATQKEKVIKQNCLIPKPHMVNQYRYTCNAIQIVSEYLHKKTPQGEVRHKWIIAFTDSFNKEHNGDDYESDLEDAIPELKSYIADSKHLHLLIIGNGLDQECVNRLNRLLSSTFPPKSKYLEYENIEGIKSILKVVGAVKEDNEFPNEKYESEKMQNY